MVGALLSEELRKKSSFETSTSEALVVRGRSKEIGENSRGNSRSKSNNRKRKLKFWYYNKVGHLKKNCWKREESKKDESKSKENSVKYDTCMINEVFSVCSVSQYNK